MRYANFANPGQREEAHRAIRNRVQMPILEVQQQRQQPAPPRPQQPPFQHLLPHEPHAFQQRQALQIPLPHEPRALQQEHLEIPLPHQPRPPQEEPLQIQIPHQPRVQHERLGIRRQPRPPQEIERQELPRQRRAPPPPPPAPVGQPDSEDDYHENEGENDLNVPHIGGNRGLNGADGRALNLFLTRELPVITHQMQQTMERLDELIRRQMENQM